MVASEPVMSTCPGCTFLNLEQLPQNPSTRESPVQEQKGDLHNGQGEVLSDYVYKKLGKACAQPVVAIMVAGAREGADGMKWSTKELVTISLVQ